MKFVFAAKIKVDIETKGFFKITAQTRAAPLLSKYHKILSCNTIRFFGPGLGIVIKLFLRRTLVLLIPAGSYLNGMLNGRPGNQPKTQKNS